MTQSVAHRYEVPGERLPAPGADPSGPDGTGQDDNGGSVVSGSSFYLALRILPEGERSAMFAIYDYCRALDDVADNPAEHGQKIDALNAWRTTVDRIFAGQDVPGLEDLKLAVERYHLSRRDFLDLIDGMMMDVDEQLQAPTWPVLDLYCDKVASAVGRLAVRVFGLGVEDGLRLARHLGRALQLTNILRDIDEDAELGRLYLPREALIQAGIRDWRPEQVAEDPKVDLACHCVASCARAEFDEADWIMASCPRKSVRAPRLMSVAYRAILERMIDEGWTPPRTRVSVNKLGLIAPVLRYGLF